MSQTPTSVKTPPTPPPTPKHVAEPQQPQAGTVPPKAEELAHKGRSWRDR